eukprot:3113569-Rhodomonas_salina.2
MAAENKVRAHQLIVGPVAAARQCVQNQRAKRGGAQQPTLERALSETPSPRNAQTSRRERPGTKT